MNTKTHHQVTSIIRKSINNEYEKYKEKYPILRHQNLIGFIIFLVSVSMIVTFSIGYLKYGWSLWIVVPINAFFMGLLHELEHDLIHWMYFKNNKIIHNIMLFVGWILRPLTINPWIRRTLHYHHHKYSGAIHDIDERGVTNGERWGLGRLLGTPDLLIGGILRLIRFNKDVKTQGVNIEVYKVKKLSTMSVLGVFPFTVIGHILIYALIILQIMLFGNDIFGWGINIPEWISNQLTWIMPLFYLILLPNIIRQFSLHFITSNMHYFGDIEDGNVVEQTQVLNAWWTLPFQVFCFFFGWTHAIHHFVVNETFYIRHLVRKPAHKIMKEYGVRFNDLGTFRRANRYNS